MPILSALGLGLAIIVLKTLTPLIFIEIQKTALLFLRGAQVSAGVATDLAASAGSIRINNSPPVLPRAPQVRTR